MEAAIFSLPEALLLSSIITIGVFMCMQSYIQPYKTTLNNTVKLIFIGIFFVIATVTLYLYPSTNGYEDVNIVVKVLGYSSFFMFCLVVVYHAHSASRHKQWNIYLTECAQKFINKYKNKYILLWDPVNHHMQNFSYHNIYQENDNGSMVPFQESLLEHI